MNQAGYPMNVRLVVKGAGVEANEGGDLEVTLSTQENVFSIPVTVPAGRSSVGVQVMAGDMLIDQETIVIRSIAVGPVVAWVLAVVVLVGAIVWAILRLR